MLGTRLCTGRAPVVLQVFELVTNLKRGRQTRHWHHWQLQ
jgi:hypothetical protein